MRRDELIAKWQARGDEHRATSARVDAAAMCAQFVADLESAMMDAPDELLTPEQAAEESGYSRPQLRRLANAGKLRITGHGREWRVARRDLPRKPRAVASTPARLHVLGTKTEQVVRASAGVDQGSQC